VIIQVLGSAAGGGFPQWNCNCANCAGVRKGLIKAQPRTQSSIAVSVTGENWALFNASPDIRTQIQSFAAFQPARRVRDISIVCIVLVDSQIDHTTGLLFLREGWPLQVYCTDNVYEDLTTGFPIMNMLAHYCGVQRHRIDLSNGGEFSIPQLAGLRLVAVPLESKAPPYSPHRHDPHPGDTIGVLLEDSGSSKRLFYAPALGKIEPHLLALMEQADCVLVDGTFWRDDELISAGISNKRAAEMGHLPQSGPGGMIEVMRGLKKPRKILIHINNTNPILREDSPERALLANEGIEVAFDGMEIVL
jgi:pyrroloquinoline quinone biosynthesis protein B